MASELEESESGSNVPQPRKTRKVRPYVDIKKLERLMYMNPILDEVCYYFDTTADHIAELIDHNHGLTFAEFRNKFRFQLKKVLQDKAVHRALEENSDRMLEICLRNINGWDTTNEQRQAAVINLQYNLDSPPEHNVKDVTPSDSSD
jgi:23S rRNA C2498 (ribose-2'-O)-methylase RlmM